MIAVMDVYLEMFSSHHYIRTYEHEGWNKNKLLKVEVMIMQVNWKNRRLKIDVK